MNPPISSSDDPPVKKWQATTHFEACICLTARSIQDAPYQGLFELVNQIDYNKNSYRRTLHRLTRIQSRFTYVKYIRCACCNGHRHSRQKSLALNKLKLAALYISSSNKNTER